MKKWVFTGISGCGRIELLNELKTEAKRIGKRAVVHDVGQLMREECARQKMPMVDERILDRDPSQLRLLRASALKDVELETLRQPDVDLHLIGIHATFRWKGRLISGVSYADLISLGPHGIASVVHDVKEVYAQNKRNTKWDEDTLPGPERTQDWMIEEEFVSEVLAEVLNVPLYIVARNHRLQNLADLFLTGKKKIYLSYPITAVREDNPDLLAEIQGPILERLQDLFVVFNPLAIKDMPLAYKAGVEEVPDLLQKLNPRSIELIKNRTVERDFQFIDQSDAVVVFYLTEKLSPGVLAEVFYAVRNQKPVFMVLPGKKSPFIEVARLFDDVDSLQVELEEFART